jgi:hypothetical protein
MNMNKNPDRILTTVERGISKIKWLDRLVNAVAEILIPQTLAMASACPGNPNGQGRGDFCHYGICEWLHGMCQRPAIYKLKYTYNDDPWVCQFPCPVNPGDPAYVIMESCAGR